MDRPPGLGRSSLPAANNAQVSPSHDGDVVNSSSPVSARPAQGDIFTRPLEPQPMFSNIQRTELRAQDFYAVPPLGEVPHRRQLQPSISAPATTANGSSTTNASSLMNQTIRSFVQTQSQRDSEFLNTPRMGSDPLINYGNTPTTQYPKTPLDCSGASLRATAGDFFPTPVQGFPGYVSASPRVLTNLQALQRLPTIPHSPSFADFSNGRTPLGISSLDSDTGFGRNCQASPGSNVGGGTQDTSTPSRVVAKEPTHTTSLPSREFAPRSVESTPRRFIELAVPFENQLSGGIRPELDRRPSYNKDAPKNIIGKPSSHAPTNTGESTSTPDDVSGRAQVGSLVPSTAVTVPQSKPKARNPKPPVWLERSHCRSFKIRKLNSEWFEEPFTGAFDVEGPMNPEMFQMPWGSRVIVIKAHKIENVILSLRHGLWACMPPVVTRIVSMFEEIQKAGNGERLYLMFSIPGSKHFCGIAEMARYLPNHMTDLWAGGEAYSEAIEVIWRFCKIVPFDLIKHVDEDTKGDAVTQMWNGMAYSEPMGRAIVQAYVETPHLQNLLAKPLEGYNFADKSVYRRNNGTNSGHRSGRANAGHNQGRQGDPQHHSSFGQHNTAASHGRYGRLCPDADGTLPPPPTFHPPPPIPAERVNSEPKLQMVPAFVHPDGTITPLAATPVSPGYVNSDKAKPFENQLTQSHGGGVGEMNNFPSQVPRGPKMNPHNPTWFHQGTGRGRIGPAKSSPSLRRPYRQNNPPAFGPRMPPPPPKYHVGDTTSSSRFGPTAPLPRQYAPSPGPRPFSTPSVYSSPRTEAGGVPLHNASTPAFDPNRLLNASPISPTAGIRNSQRNAVSHADSANVTENMAQINSQSATLQPDATRLPRAAYFQGSSYMVQSAPASSGQGTHGNISYSQKGPSFSHRARHEPAKDSMDSRSNFWVDKLVASPNQGKAEPAAGQGGVSLDAHMQHK